MAETQNNKVSDKTLGIIGAVIGVASASVSGYVLSASIKRIAEGATVSPWLSIVPEVLGIVIGLVLIVFGVQMARAGAKTETTKVEKTSDEKKDKATESGKPSDDESKNETIDSTTDAESDDEPTEAEKPSDDETENETESEKTVDDESEKTEDDSVTKTETE